MPKSVVQIWNFSKKSIKFGNFFYYQLEIDEMTKKNQ